MGVDISSNNRPGAQPTPDETVDRILERAKSPLELREAKKLVEALEKVSRAPSTIYRRTQPAGDRCCSPISK